MNLSAYPFAPELEEEAITFLANHAKPISVPKGNILFYQGDTCDNVLLLTKGEVRLYMQPDTTEEITLYTLYAGEQCIVNTASTLSQTDAIATAETVTDIEGYLIDVESLKKLTHISAVYQSFVFSLYNMRMGALVELVNDVKFKTLDQRILKWLEVQEEKMVKTTHEQVANIMGTTRVVVSRVLKEMEHKGQVHLHRGAIERL